MSDADPLRDDRALLDAFRAGDPAALERVYYAYVDRVFDLVRYGFLLGSGRRVPGVADPSAQRERVHDIFLKAFGEKARLSYDGLRPYRPFLVRLAKNLLIDQHRAQGAEVPLDDEPVEDAAAPEAPEDDLHWRNLLKETREWLTGADEELRRFIALRFEGELPQRDVATQMGVTRRRVRTLEERALSFLKAHLRGRGFI